MKTLLEKPSKTQIKKCVLGYINIFAKNYTLRSFIFITFLNPLISSIFFISFLSLISLLTLTQEAQADYGNYNSILIGERAAGMGGAYTALTNDPSGSPYYNPASLSRMEGNSLSAAVSIYNKYDTSYDETNDFGQAPLRVNRGAFKPIPSSSGTVHSFKNFAFAISIIFPDFEAYNGIITSTSKEVSTLNLRDESLWVGGSLAFNASHEDAFGLSMYYTSRNYSRSVTDRSKGTINTVSNEEKNYTHNSIVYVLGYYRPLTQNWTIGLSHRFQSLPISGTGNYFSSTVSTQPSETLVNQIDLHSNTMIPPKTSLGIAYEEPKKETYSVDISFYDSEKYQDIDFTQGYQIVRHKPIWNINLGYENYLKEWLAMRLGLYSNFSSFDKVPDSPTELVPDHIDMWGFSTNFAIFTSKQSSITLGGYYTGGKGYSIQTVDHILKKVPKSLQIFSFLVGTSYQF